MSILEHADNIRRLLPALGVKAPPANALDQARYDAMRVKLLDAQAAVCRARANLCEVEPGKSHHEREDARAFWLREAAEFKRLADELNETWMHRNDVPEELACPRCGRERCDHPEAMNAREEAFEKESSHG